MISAEGKKAINTYVPLAAAGTAGYIAYRRGTDWKVLLAVIGAAWLLTWLISRNTFSLLDSAAAKPDALPINPNVTGYLPANFNAAHWAKRIRDDVYSGLTEVRTRDADLYDALSAMNDSQLLAISNVWNQQYYNEYREQLYEAINAEWIMWLSPLWFTKNKLVERIKALTNN